MSNPEYTDKSIEKTDCEKVLVEYSEFFEGIIKKFEENKKDG